MPSRWDKVYWAYYLHKYTAKRRDIEFHFAFEEWVNWWYDNLGPEWFSKRGRQKGQYVMARNGDIGPYSRQNVECITHQENARRAEKTPCLGEGNGRSKVTSQEALKIYNSSETLKEIALKFNISRSTVARIKDGRRWSHITRHKSDLTPSSK